MFQGLLADVKKGYFGINGNLSLSDFQSTLGATGRTYGPYFPPLVGGWYNLDLTVGKGYVNKLATFSGMTQIRLRFKLEDNNNAVANYIKFYSGNSGLATQPQLIVEYYIP